MLLKRAQITTILQCYDVVEFTPVFTFGVEVDNISAEYIINRNTSEG
jgi:hypothetical protein